VQIKLGEAFSLRHFLFPKDNHWRKRVAIVFAFVFFDYVSTLAFCSAPHEEANVYARVFMEIFGILPGLTLFVLIINLPIYVVLSIDSHVIKLPYKFGFLAEIFVDGIFAWYIAGLHFSGGTSWFWCAPDSIRQIIGTAIYFALSILLVKPYKPQFDPSKMVCA
jgi:hypothetical protein